jgi:hypothetical protein
MSDIKERGLIDGVPIEILDAYERRAKDVAALWGDASPAARQARVERHCGNLSDRLTMPKGRK